MTDQDKDIQKLRACCHYLISLSERDDIGISNKKLQKLLYIAQCYSIYLQKTQGDSKDQTEALLSNEFQAWVHGSVIPYVYQMYRDFGYHPISIAEIDQDLINDNLSDQNRNILDKVWKGCGHFDSDYLENINHQDEAWKAARRGIDDWELSTSVISKKDISEHCSLMLKKLNLLD